MKISVYDTIIPYVVIDDWFTDEELKSVWSEVNFYTHGQPKNKILRADETVVARENNKSLAESYRWYPCNYFHKDYTDISPLFRYSNKLKNKELHNSMAILYPWYNMFTSTNISNIMVSYYEEGDYYKPHHDMFMWTQLIWITKEPKEWTGGDFYVYPEEDKREKILYKNNRSVIFPSMMKHEVEPIKWKDKKPENGYGRYTISYFLYHEIERD